MAAVGAVVLVPVVAGSAVAADAPARVSSFGVSGSRLVVADAQAPFGLYESNDNGTTWAPLQGTNAGKPLQLEGASLLTHQGDVVRVRGTGGELTFPATGEAVLGKGGRLVSYRAAGVSTAEVWDVATKTKVADYAPPFAMVGSVVWKVTAVGALTGKDLGSAEVRTIKVASGCLVGPGQVNGRWALLSGCTGGDQVIDVNGPEAPRILTVGQDAQLGNGFVAQTVDDEVLVTDLNDRGLQHRRYGPIDAAPGPAAVRADGSGGTKVGYLAPAGPRVETLSWLAEDPQPRPDTAAPVLVSASAGERVRDNNGLAFEWKYQDPDDPNSPASGLDTYDLRIQQRPNRTSPYGPWNQLPAWQGLRTTAASTTAAKGVDTCWQVRARDKLGNLSDWSASFCSEVDGTAPTAVTLRIGDRVDLAATTTFRWAYRDETEVASYDVAYKIAAPGGRFGGWMYPAVWQNTRLTSIGYTPRAGYDECFIVRARDYLENLSAWSPEICSAAPQDDRALTATGNVTRTTSSLAYKGTTSTLRASGAYLSKNSESAVRVAVAAIHGPGQGRVDVYHANIKLGTLNLAAAATARKLTYFPVTPYRSGAVKIVSTSTAPAQIDAAAFLRQ